MDWSGEFSWFWNICTANAESWNVHTQEGYADQTCSVSIPRTDSPETLMTSSLKDHITFKKCVTSSLQRLRLPNSPNRELLKSCQAGGCLLLVVKLTGDEIPLLLIAKIGNYSLRNSLLLKFTHYSLWNCLVTHSKIRLLLGYEIHSLRGAKNVISIFILLYDGSIT